MNEIERRLSQASRKQRDLRLDYSLACQEVRKTHSAFKKSRSSAAQDHYARALREMDICTRTLEFQEEVA